MIWRGSCTITTTDPSHLPRRPQFEDEDSRKRESAFTVPGRGLIPGSYAPWALPLLLSPSRSMMSCMFWVPWTRGGVHLVQAALAVLLPFPVALVLQPGSVHVGGHHRQHAHHGDGEGSTVVAASVVVRHPRSAPVSSFGDAFWANRSGLAHYVPGLTERPIPRLQLVARGSQVREGCLRPLADRGARLVGAEPVVGLVDAHEVLAPRSCCPSPTGRSPRRCCRRNAGPPSPGAARSRNRPGPRPGPRPASPPSLHPHNKPSPSFIPPRRGPASWDTARAKPRGHREPYPGNTTPENPTTLWHPPPSRKPE